MINLDLRRHYLKEEYTIGKLYVRGKYFCDTLEDKVRDINKDGNLEEGKIYARTAIPYGSYKIRIMYSPKFHRDLPILIAVPYFIGIMIHAGNTAEDSSGCILIGENKQKGRLINSRKCEDKLVEILKSYLRIGEEIIINIT